jgi:hypothetical protein
LKYRIRSIDGQYFAKFDGIGVAYWFSDKAKAKLWATVRGARATIDRMMADKVHAHG